MRDRDPDSTWRWAFKHAYGRRPKLEELRRYKHWHWVSRRDGFAGFEPPEWRSWPTKPIPDDTRPPFEAADVVKSPCEQVPPEPAPEPSEPEPSVNGHRIDVSEPVIELAPEPELTPVECPAPAQSESLVCANGHAHRDIASKPNGAAGNGRRRARGSVAAAKGAALAAKRDEADAPMAARRLLMDRLACAAMPRSAIVREAAAAGLSTELIDAAAVQLGVRMVEGRWTTPR
jgi:hypothetical protein